MPLSRSRSRPSLGRLIAVAMCITAGGTPLLAGAAPSASARGAASDAAHCVDARRLDLTRVLAPPPAAGSAQQRAELDEMLDIQARRSPAQAERARLDAEVSVFRFADALDSPPQFTAARLPRTAALFRDLTADESAVMNAAKDRFARPRPFSVEPRLAPAVDKPASASYPSGHSTWAYAAGLVLADLVPERRVQILARAEEYAHNRVVGGVHYPSDVQAGRLAGTALTALLFRCAPFVKEEASARAELRAALGSALAPEAGTTRLRQPLIP